VIQQERIDLDQVSRRISWRIGIFDRAAESYTRYRIAAPARAGTTSPMTKSDVLCDHERVDIVRTVCAGRLELDDAGDAHGHNTRIRAVPSAVRHPVGIRGGWLGQPLGLLRFGLPAGCF
jgi:hypothetical protein